jgi:hydroxymethylpyrimidine pyrophosphatase-like HAD family hydrolase
VNTQTPAVPAATIRLVIADVDGTLVTPDKVLTARAISAVARLREAHVLFAITSGWPPKGMKMLVDALPVVC